MGALAPLGTAFTYQGQLKSSGSPVNGNCDLAFRLYDAGSLGNQIGNPITSTVPVANGLFTVYLNAMNEFGSSAFTGDARFLDVRVRCPAGSGSFTTLSPRQPLTGSPYALGLMPGATVNGSGSSLLTIQNSSTAGSVAAVQGTITPMSPGSYSTGVRGINNGTSGNGIGVWGSQAGSGYGVYGTAASGIGVLGEVTSPGGTGVWAKGSGSSSTALAIDNGAIRVTGANKPVFVHAAIIGGLSSNGCDVDGQFVYDGTVLDNPYTNGNPNVILIVTTQSYTSTITAARTSARPIAVVYSTGGPPYQCDPDISGGRWIIFTTDNSAIADGSKFNVMVIKP